MLFSPVGLRCAPAFGAQSTGGTVLSMGNPTAFPRPSSWGAIMVGAWIRNHGRSLLEALVPGFPQDLGGQLEKRYVRTT